MNKIKTSSSDYTWYGLGYNNYNYCKNVIPKINHWLVLSHRQLLNGVSFKE